MQKWIEFFRKHGCEISHRSDFTNQYRIIGPTGVKVNFWASTKTFYYHRPGVRYTNRFCHGYDPRGRGFLALSRVLGLRHHA